MEELPKAEIIKKKRVRTSPLDRDYISNKDFTAALAVWIESNKGKEKKDWSRMPDYIGTCFMKLVTNYSNKGNWRNYTYKDEMQSEAILTCIKYAGNFDITRTQNAFAYFTQIVHNSFLQILSKEKGFAELKNKALSESNPYNYNNIHLDDSSNGE